MASTARTRDRQYNTAKIYINQADVESLIRLLTGLIESHCCGYVDGTVYDWGYRTIVGRLYQILTAEELADLLTQISAWREQVEQELLMQEHTPVCEQLTVL